MNVPSRACLVVPIAMGCWGQRAAIGTGGALGMGGQERHNLATKRGSFATSKDVQAELFAGIVAE